MDTHLLKIYEYYKPEFEIYESLILSHPLYTVISILSRKRFNIKPNYKTNTFSIQYIFDEDYLIALSQLNDLLQVTNNLGWFPSSFSSYDTYNRYKTASWDENKINFKEFILLGFTNILFSFEAKFDILVDKYPTILYHVCKENVVKKILEYGLSPKSRTKKSFHPERVYLLKSLKDAYELINVFSKEYFDKFAILKIDTSTIDVYLKLFKDPNYLEKGYYTLNHITPYCISLYKIIE